MNKKELLKHVGSVEQIGSIRDITFNDGKAKGVRAIEVNTGNLRFTVLPDRCMDIAQAHYKGQAISWLSKTGITAPEFYEKDDKNWLRGFYGGLITTCGLHNIGRPVGEHGLHGRIANTPAQKVCVFADWVGEEYVMRISGEMRESMVFGSNLVLKRVITTKLFSDEFTVEDTIVNEGFQTENIALCYHCNFGYPLVQDSAKIVNVPVEVSEITKPMHGKEEECISVDYSEETVTVGIENEGIGAYLTYERNTLPDFLIWKMLGESEYVIGLEPRTTEYGGQDIIDNDAYVKLEPFGEYRTKLEFSVRERNVRE
ncbi:MAG: DUF4432 family protein [Lachnospiraceae bacterium]|nr:DUF4432 family protein [Lachnospiraceae bacterium]